MVTKYSNKAINNNYIQLLLALKRETQTKLTNKPHSQKPGFGVLVMELMNCEDIAMAGTQKDGQQRGVTSGTVPASGFRPMAYKGKRGR